MTNQVIWTRPDGRILIRPARVVVYDVTSALKPRSTLLIDRHEAWTLSGKLLAARLTQRLKKRTSLRAPRVLSIWLNIFEARYCALVEDSSHDEVMPGEHPPEHELKVTC